MSKPKTDVAVAAKMNLFIPLAKVDEENRLVYGTIAAEVVDRAGEVFDYETSKPYFEEWSGNVEKASGGRSLGNVREMHKAVGAGKLTDIAYDDTARTIECCAKVVDDDAWNKVLEGVYTGFSMGGSYVKKWTADGLKRYTAGPSEVSLVDYPCIPTATFEVVKADGASEMRKFHHWAPNNDELLVEARALAKAAGNEDLWPDQCTAARESLLQKRGDEVLAVAGESAEPVAEVAEVPAEAEPTATVEGAGGDDAIVDAEPPAEEAAKAAEPGDLKQLQLWAAPDGKTFEKKADARAYWDAKDPVAAALAKAAALAAGEPEAVAKGAPCPELQAIATTLQVLRKTYADNVLVKGLYSVSRLADITASLTWLAQDSVWEEEMEGDTASAVPQALYDNLKALGATLVAMASEEVGELLEGLQSQGVDVVLVDSDPIILELATKTLGLEKIADAELRKAGKRNSAKDQDMVNAIHDHACTLGADCGGTAEKMAKGADALQVENLELKKQVDQAVTGITSLGAQLGELTKRLHTLEAQPAPRAADVQLGKVVTKDGDSGGMGGGDQAAVLAKAVEELGPEGVATALIKNAQRHPMPMVGRPG